MKYLAALVVITVLTCAVLMRAQVRTETPEQVVLAFIEAAKKR